MPQPRPGLRDIPPFQLGESSIPGIAVTWARSGVAAKPDSAIAAITSLFHNPLSVIPAASATYGAGRVWVGRHQNVT